MQFIQSRMIVVAACWTLVLAVAAGASAQSYGPTVKPGAGKRVAKGNRTDPAGSPDRAKARPAADRKGPTTMIFVEILTGAEGAGIKAHRWSQIFEKLDVTLTVRAMHVKDKLGITEKKIGDSIRQIYIRGQLEPNGKLTLDNRVFSESDVEKLAAWLEELRNFGAQGSPEGQPAWGLDRQQFGELHAVLSQPLAADAEDQGFTNALKQFRLPEEFPLKLTDDAARMLQESRVPLKSPQTLKGMSQGTALAVLLAEQRLGFRPRRRQDGTVELSIGLLSETIDPWPVGWPREKPAPATAPRLFHSTPIDLTDIELDAVLDAAAGIIGVPILVDRAALADKGIDLATIKVSHPAKRTTWIQALNALLPQAKAKSELLIDEAGRPFLWVTPVGTPRRPQKE
ncbi:MAG: hypothetical protein ACKV0T_05570 [Planctomycetales bacterium]